MDISKKRAHSMARSSFSPHSSRTARPHPPTHQSREEVGSQPSINGRQNSTAIPHSTACGASLQPTVRSALQLQGAKRHDTPLVSLFPSRLRKNRAATLNCQPRRQKNLPRALWRTWRVREAVTACGHAQTEGVEKKKTTTTQAETAGSQRVKKVKRAASRRQSLHHLPADKMSCAIGVAHCDASTLAVPEGGTATANPNRCQNVIATIVKSRLASHTRERDTKTRHATKGTSSPQTVRGIPTPQGPSLALLCRAPQHPSPWPSRTHAPSSSFLIFAPLPPRPTPAPRSITGEHTTGETAKATPPPVALAMEVHRARNGEELSVQLDGTVYNLLSVQMPPFFRQGVLGLTSHCVPQDVVALIPSLFAVISLVRVLLQILRGNRDAVRFPATAFILCGDGVRLQRAPPPHLVKSTAKPQSGISSENTPRWRSTPAATPPVGEAAWCGWQMA
ncbi:hypothetical protein TCSYLVIO_007952 [Trypanosoma cruzi]|nr:hypothetical protein TCSYLVIO_007952 [Trypanosoma cruzi]